MNDVRRVQVVQHQYPRRGQASRRDGRRQIGTGRRGRGCQIGRGWTVGGRYQSGLLLLLLLLDELQMDLLSMLECQKTNDPVIDLID